MNNRAVKYIFNYKIVYFIRSTKIRVFPFTYDQFRCEANTGSHAKHGKPIFGLIMKDILHYTSLKTKA